MKLLLVLSLIIFSGSLAFSKDVVLKGHRSKKKYIQAATVWKNPGNLSAQDIYRGPRFQKNYENLLAKDDVYCLTNVNDQKRGFGGATPKFYCQLLKKVNNSKLVPVTKKSGKRRVIKVKYSPPHKENNEVESEILGTRLLWALGFYADRMFSVKRVHCFGCTTDPYKNRKVNPSSLKTPQVFNNTAVEKKISGDKVLSPQTVNGREVLTAGVKFGEMMRNLPSKETHPKAWATQLAHRDALRLLAIFMNHGDAKPDNQRIVCSKKNNQGQCTKALMMIQDVGSSFGLRIKNFRIEKTNLRTWANTPIWKNPQQCEALLTKDPAVTIFMLAHDPSILSPKISESGRVFLAQQLEKFASNKARVRALFRAAGMDRRSDRGESLEDWVRVFMHKVAQVRYPLGKENPHFKCPPTRRER